MSKLDEDASLLTGHVALWRWDDASATLTVRGSLGPSAVAGTWVGPLSQLVHPEDVERVRAGLSGLSSGARPAIELEHRVRSSVGTWRQVLNRGRAVAGPEGRPAAEGGASGVFIDVTRQSEAELERDTARDHLAAFVEHAPAAVAMFDREMRYLRASRRWIDDYSLGREEVLGRCHYDLFPDVAAAWKEVHQRCLGGAVERHEGQRFERADRGHVWVRWEVRPWFERDDEIGGLVMLTEDVTGLFDAAADLRRAQRLLQLAVDTMPQRVYWKDLEGRFQGCNQAFAIDAGLAHPSEIVGRTDFDFAWRAYAEDYREADRAVAATGSARLGYEKPYVMADGTEIWVRASKLPLRDDDGAVVGVMGTLEDVSEERAARDLLRRAKETAEAANHAKSMFLANMSHEIRTPMNAILGMTQLVLESDLTAEQSEHLQTVHTAALALLGIIDEILDFSKVESGNLTLSPFPFDVRPWLQRLVGLLDVRARERGIRLSGGVAPEVPPTLVADEVRLGQVLLNLVGNAIKFTPRDGEVRVDVSLAGEGLIGGSDGDPRDLRLQLAVSDTGIGIPEDKIESIFSPFTQADDSTTREFGGTGLGLSIARQVIEQMDGRIWVESTHGEGSTFYATARASLPPSPGAVAEDVATVAEPAPQSGSVAALEGNGAGPHPGSPPPAPVETGGAAPPPSTPCPAGDGLRVLVVEDNPVNWRLAQKLLEREGCSTELATNGLEAVAVLAHARGGEDPYDLVLMDCQMPVMNGWDATREIRRAEDEAGTGRHLHIVAITANAMPGDRERCLESGMDDYLAKPVNRALLRRILSDSVARREARRERSRRPAA